MTTALSLLQYALISVGVFFFLVGTIGLLRFPDTFTRIHAITKADNLGLGFVVLGLLPATASIPEALQFVLCWLLVLAASATAGYLIANKVIASKKTGAK